MESAYGEYRARKRSEEEGSSVSGAEESGEALSEDVAEPSSISPLGSGDAAAPPAPAAMPMSMADAAGGSLEGISSFPAASPLEQIGEGGAGASYSLEAGAPSQDDFPGGASEAGSFDPNADIGLSLEDEPSGYLGGGRLPFRAEAATSLANEPAGDGNKGPDSDGIFDPHTMPIPVPEVLNALPDRSRFPHGRSGMEGIPMEDWLELEQALSS